MLMYLTYSQYDVCDKRVICGGFVETNFEMIDGIFQNTDQIIFGIEDIQHPSRVHIYLYDPDTYTDLIAFATQEIGCGVASLRIKAGNYCVSTRPV